MNKLLAKNHKRLIFLLSVILAAFIVMPPVVFAAEIEEQQDVVSPETNVSVQDDTALSVNDVNEETEIETFSEKTEKTEESPVFQDEAPASFSVTVENEKSPSGELILCSSYSIGGTIISESVIAKVYGGIYTADGESVVYREVTPNANECSISQNFDAAMTFGSLKIGNYVFKLEAEDSEGNKAVAVNSAFSVVDGVIPSEITVTDESLPADQFPQGSGFSIRGMITSTYRLASVRGAYTILTALPPP